jgi:chromosomal replication initiator protein
MADIGVPDLETRIAIIRNKANYLEVNLNDEAVNLIASKIKTDIRKLEGVINKISAFMSIQDRPLTIMEINKIIDDFIKPEIITTELIIRETAKYFQLRPEDLRSENRSKNHAIARQIAMYEMQIIKKMSLQDIEKELGRNHTTALSSIRKINKLIVSDKDLARAIQDIESNIKNSVG